MLGLQRHVGLVQQCLQRVSILRADEGAFGAVAVAAAEDGAAAEVPFRRGNKKQTRNSRRMPQRVGVHRKVDTFREDPS